MHVVVRAVIDIVDVLVVPKVVVVVVVLVLGVGVVDVTAVVGEGRRVDVGVVVEPPPDFGASIWKLTSDVGVGDVAVLVVAVVDVLVVNGIVVGVAVVFVVDVVGVAVVVVVVLLVDAVVVGAVVRGGGVVDVLAFSGVVVVVVVALVVVPISERVWLIRTGGRHVVEPLSDLRALVGACSLAWSSWASWCTSWSSSCSTSPGSSSPTCSGSRRGVVDPPSDFGSSIWKPTSDVGVGEIAELVVAVVDVLVVNGVGVSVAVVLVVDGVVVAVVIVVVRSFFRDTSRCRRSRACAVFSKISHN